MWVSGALPCNIVSINVSSVLVPAPATYTVFSSGCQLSPLPVPVPDVVHPELCWVPSAPVQVTSLPDTPAVIFLTPPST